MTDITGEAEEYEAKQIVLIKGWEAEGESLLASAWNMLMAPVGWTLQQVIPPGAIEGALHANLWLADQWADQNSILAELQAETFAELADHELSRLDGVADGVHDGGILYGGGVGAANGVGGLLFAPLGIPGIINVALRTIRKIGLCYGYDELNDAEKLFIFHVLSMAGSGGPAGKAASLLALRQLQVMLAKQTFKSMAAKAAENSIGKEAFIIALREFGKQIGLQLTRSRLLMAIPVVGGGVGLLVDGNYIRGIGWAARRVYQKRWLRDRGRWPGDDEGPIIQGEAAA